MFWNKWTLISIVLFLVAVVFGEDEPFLLMLTVAQIAYVPLTLRMIMKRNDWFSRYYPYFTIPASFSVIFLHITNPTSWDYLFAAIYLLFTCVVAFYGISRFISRGFIHFEEFSIDLALIYLSIGGMWFFAYITKIDTGFSPMITWLTAIHFHYAAFILLVFVGLLGRIYKPKLYPLAASILLISLMLLAIGITFSVWIEWVSVVFYMIGIYMMIYITLRAPFVNQLQKGLILVSFGSLGVTIVFSFLYAFGRLTNYFSVSIGFMLQFHGFLNCMLFALVGLVGWSIFIPHSKKKKWAFPNSQIRGNIVIGEKILPKILDDRNSGLCKGLVDEMTIYEPYIDTSSLSPKILDFYENTIDYRLYAEVRWSTWFKPFAAIYRLFSSFVQQINLPLSSKRIEMTGDILKINKDLDGRMHPRAWIRKIKKKCISQVKIEPFIN
ncbi:membrane protein [Lysinibacillus sp. PLM2]|nr:membrane protein [Lysinibacillus sp. PLM2]